MYQDPRQVGLEFYWGKSLSGQVGVQQMSIGILVERSNYHVVDEVYFV